jgi:hypothetical protein
MRRGGGARQEGTSFNLRPAGNRQRQPPPPTSEGAARALSGWMSWAPVSPSVVSIRSLWPTRQRLPPPASRHTRPACPGASTSPPLTRLPPVRDHWCRKPGSTLVLEWINPPFSPPFAAPAGAAAPAERPPKIELLLPLPLLRAASVQFPVPAGVVSSYPQTPNPLDLLHALSSAPQCV